MLIKGFYNVVEIIEDDNGLSYQIKLNEDHEVYKGHFDGQPVVPGVIQLQIIRELVENYLSKKLMMDNVVQVKYLVPIIPNTSPLLDYKFLKIEQEEHQVSTVVEIRARDQVFTKAKIKFSIA